MTDKITIKDLYDGKAPKGYVNIQHLQPKLGGFYDTICVVGSVNAKVQKMNKMYKLYPYTDDNGDPCGRWVEGDWIKVLAWKERTI